MRVIMQIRQHDANEVTQADKETTGNNVIDERFLPGEQTGDNGHGSEKGDAKHNRRGNRLQPEVQIEHEHKIDNQIGQQEIFHSLHPFVEDTVIALHVQEASDETEIKKIRQNNKGLVHVKGQQGMPGKNKVNAHICFLFIEKVGRYGHQVQEVIEVFLLPDDDPLKKHIQHLAEHEAHEEYFKKHAITRLFIVAAIGTVHELPVIDLDGAEAVSRCFLADFKQYFPRLPGKDRQGEGGRYLFNIRPCRMDSAEVAAG